MKRLKERTPVRSIQKSLGILVAMIGCSLWLSSCTPGSQKSKEADEHPKAGTAQDSLAWQEMGRGGLDTLTYTYDEYQLESQWKPADSLAGREVDTTQQEMTRFLAKYPIFSEEDVKAFVLRAHLGNDTSDVARTAQQFIHEYEAFQDSFPMPRTWTSETESKVVHVTPNYLGLKTHHYSYTGGAHGVYWIMYAHYWLHDQQDLFLEDIIEPSQMEEFLQVAADYFWAQERFNQSDMQPELYFFEDMQFHVPDNFHFERDSLMFLYNIYEIKPYVYGHTEFRVPYSAIDKHLTDRAHYIIHDIQQK